LSSQLNWIVTAYTLTSTSFIPSFGQLADIYGRHAALQISLVFMLVGSVLCAAAQTWAMLIFGRALQGISAAGISTVTRIILADNVNLEDNAKNNTIFSFVVGFAFAVGPVIGGFLTNAGWRYCFVLSIPLAVISHVIVFMVRDLFKKGNFRIKNRNSVLGLTIVDYPGMALFILGVGLLILGVSWGNAPYSWSSPAVVVPLVFGAILFSAFFAYEYMAEPERFIGRRLPRQVPMMPWILFSKKDAGLLSVIGFATGGALNSAFYFISLYWSLAKGMSPGDAGLQLLYYTPGLGRKLLLNSRVVNGIDQNSRRLYVHVHM
jgi:MFS family permease